MPGMSLQISQICAVVGHLDYRAYFGRVEPELIRVSPNAGQGSLESLIELDVRHRSLEDELVVLPDVGDHVGVKLELRFPVQPPEISLCELYKDPGPAFVCPLLQPRLQFHRLRSSST